MEPSTDITYSLDESPLDKGVDILVGPRHKTRVGAAEFENLAETCGNGLCVVRGEDGGRGQRLGPRDATLHVVLE